MQIYTVGIRETSRTYINLSSHDTYIYIESIWIEISISNSKPILVCSVYRPPSAPCSWVTELCCELNRAFYDNREMIMMGDYNIDHLKDIPRYWSEALEEFELT